MYGTIITFKDIIVFISRKFKTRFVNRTGLSKYCTDVKTLTLIRNWCLSPDPPGPTDSSYSSHSSCSLRSCAGVRCPEHHCTILRLCRPYRKKPRVLQNYGMKECTCEVDRRSADSLDFDLRRLPEVNNIIVNNIISCAPDRRLPQWRTYRYAIKQTINLPGSHILECVISDMVEPVA